MLSLQDADVNKTGTLDHTEIVGMVAQIPGLDKDEQCVGQLLDCIITALRLSSSWAVAWAA